jgi:hypothetical protein
VVKQSGNWRGEPIEQEGVGHVRGVNLVRVGT